MSNTIQDSGWNASGRFGRRSYIAWNMLLGFCFMIIGIIAAFILPRMSPETLDGKMSMPLMVMLVLIYGVAIYFSVIFLIRRLHDRNHNGWLSLLIFVPVVNLVFTLYLLLAPGHNESNEYGPPRTTRGWETLLVVLYLVLAVILAAFAVPAYQNYVERAQQAQMEQSSYHTD